jgi:uncharacterized RDD family membrane protein YckC
VSPDEGRRAASPTRRPEQAPLKRRFASLFYDALLLTAVLWCAGLPFAAVEQYLGTAHTRAVYQLYLAAVAGVYFTWQWLHGGATLAMKTWRLKLVSCDGDPLTRRQAIVRYVAALAGLALFAIGFLWPVVDRHRAFLHDRIARTRIVRAPE